MSATELPCPILAPCRGPRRQVFVAGVVWRKGGDHKNLSAISMTELVLLPAERQLELLRSREISVLELAEAHIRQIERLNPKLNALVDFDAERVRAQARGMDARPNSARAAAWLAGDGEVVHRHRRLSLRNRQPAS